MKSNRTHFGLLLNVLKLRISQSRNYGWKSASRLQNPNLVKDIPTFQFVKDGKLDKVRLLYVCGLGSTGSLGLTKYYNLDENSIGRLKPKHVSSCTFRRQKAFSTSDRIVDVSCGYGFTLVAARTKGSDQTAFGFGLNSHSQLGFQATRPGFPLEAVATPSPIFLPTKSPIVKVSCGRSHSLLLTESGQIFSLGNNSLGQCGREIEEKEEYFASKRIHQIVELPKDVCQLECGQDHSMFLSRDGRIFACGWSADGQTGLGHYKNQAKVSQVRGDIEGVKIVKVSCRADTALALSEDGQVFGWGNSEYAQFRLLANCKSEQFNLPRHLKLPNIAGKIVDIAAGGTICAILNDLGQVFVWGFGILGKGPEVDHSSRPTKIPESLFNMNVYNPDAKIEKIYASLSHFAAISNQGDLYTWGKNKGNSLGFAHGEHQYYPMRVNMNLGIVKKVALGVDHSCALVEKVC